MIGALLAQGVGAPEAAMLGATLHARAARAAEAELTSFCVVPEDVVEALPLAVKALLRTAPHGTHGEGAFPD